ncbi:MAG: hypothetical protein K8F52_13045 [Candidatus Scalindua rubra]|uniref:Uncharacterized protein n=1 Tax=Candidatus Scalindua brodae TaxID=237368 RepID=A0A0B0ECQ9_9BACT|nr:MAG: hypothetical protein SCABRO_03844 [Candidatus Scalindua brodae]MBZ0109587.1 hypothetical protein [Candidatus Scalindua rubra]TWU33159.1 hypothetical protein S225a_16110 [Candidatus Brocadiaceae bacterium S225]
MSKILSFFKKELRELIPTTIFFLVTFHIIAFSRALMLEQYGIKLSTSGTATVGALIVAKVILIFNKLSFVNMFSGKPLLFSIIWKTFIFSLFTLLFRCVEELIPLISKYGSLPVAGQHLIHEIVWPHFWSSQIVLLVALFLFCSTVELIREIGAIRMKEIFFGCKQ